MRLLLYWFSLALLCSTPMRVCATTVSGVVVDQSGGPIVGAPVGLYTDSGNWETLTAESGRFVFDNVPPGVYELQVTSPGFLVHFDPNYEVGKTDQTALRITLEVGSDPPCGRWFHGATDSRCYFGGRTTYTGALGKPALTGKVSVFNRHLGDAAVVLTRMGEKQAFAESRTDENGQFQFRDLGVGRYEVWVKRDGCSDSGASNVRIKYGKVADITIESSCP
jgi:Carboxypeptidase regulatory-like domain